MDQVCSLTSRFTPGEAVRAKSVRLLLSLMSSDGPAADGDDASMAGVVFVSGYPSDALRPTSAHHHETGTASCPSR